MKSNTEQHALVLDAAPYTQKFALAEEVALSISYNGINYAVMLITPNDIEDFIVGFSLNNDIIEHPRQLYGIELTHHKEHINAEVEIANQAFWKLKENKRQLAGASGCGLCGVEALDNALPQLTSINVSPLPDVSWFKGLRSLISKRNVLVCREDIGRHNAFDKLIGAITTQKLFQPEGIVVLTSRCSLELVQKAIRAKLPLVVTLSAPTALSVKWASRYGLTLIHVPKYDPPRAYAPQEK